MGFGLQRNVKHSDLDKRQGEKQKRNRQAEIFQSKTVRVTLIEALSDGSAAD